MPFDGALEPREVLALEILEVDQLGVQVVLEVLVRVVHERDATGHARTEVAAGLAEDDDLATRHVLAAVVADAFDDGRGSGVADREALTRDATDEDLTRGGTEQDDVAGDDVVLGHETLGRIVRRAHDDATTRQALADEVVRVAVEPHRDAARDERTEAVAGRTCEGDVDRVVRQPFRTVLLGELVAEHRADGAVDVGDRSVERDRRTRLESGLRFRDQLVVECLVESVVLLLGAVHVLLPEDREVTFSSSGDRSSFDAR